MRLSFVAASLVAATFLLGCAAETDADEEQGAAEEQAGADALTGSVPSGSKLVTTTSVNLRKSASTASSILHVVPKGAVVTVLDASPVSGFYHVSHGGQSGWCYGAYLQKASSGSGGSAGAAGSTGGGPGPSASALLAALGSCNVISSSRLRTDESAATATVDVCGGSGVVWWKADLDVDCDGKKSSVCNSSTDASYQSQTAATDSHGAYLDAATLPYVVVPLVSSRFDYKKAGLSLGTVVAVVYKDKVVYGIIGDLGPASAIGEASYAMAKALGINPDPSYGGTDAGVTYIAFPGATVAKKEDNAEAVSVGVAKAKALTGG